MGSLNKFPLAHYASILVITVSVRKACTAFVIVLARFARLFLLCQVVYIVLMFVFSRIFICFCHKETICNVTNCENVLLIRSPCRHSNHTLSPSSSFDPYKCKIGLLFIFIFGPWSL